MGANSHLQKEQAQIQKIEEWKSQKNDEMGDMHGSMRLVTFFSFIRLNTNTFGAVVADVPR